MLYVKPAIVLDKSYVQRAKRQQLEELFNEYDVLATNCFLYETIDSLENSRADELEKKLKWIPNRLPSYIRVDTSRLIRYEWEHGSPALVDRSIKSSFNPQYWSSYKSLSDADKNLMETFKLQRVQTSVANWKKQVTQEFPGVSDQEIASISSTDKEVRDRQIIELSKRIQEKSFVLRIAEQEDMPLSRLYTEEFFNYRWFQAELLHGLWLKCISPGGKMQRPDANLEHDVHDLDYLALALHVGALATTESASDLRKLGWRFKFLRPDGNLRIIE